MLVGIAVRWCDPGLRPPLLRGRKPVHARDGSLSWATSRASTVPR